MCDVFMFENQVQQFLLNPTHGNHSVNFPVDAFAMDNDDFGIPAPLDGSIDALRMFLGELASIMGQSGEGHQMPIIELQFGDLMTKTSLTIRQNEAFLSVTAFLPKGGGVFQSTHGVRAGDFPSVCNNWHDILWHADEGRYVIVRRFAVAELLDERSVMDAILDSADWASTWHASITPHNER